MRRLDLLITQSRRTTENEDFTATTGIPDEDFIQYFNDAQDRMQTVISLEHPDVFLAEKIISSVAGQESYDIPSDAFLGNRVENIQFSTDGTEDDYYNVKQGRLAERTSGIRSAPSFYIRRSGKILLQPQPENSAGKIRITYQQKLPRLDVRRGSVLSVVLGAGNTITSLTLDTASSIGETELEEQGFISIVDKNGNVKMKNIPITDVDSTTGVVTVEAGFTFEAGETISAGNFALAGPNTTTHSQLPDVCERYLLSYVNWKIFKRDSSNDSVEGTSELQAIEQDIVASFKQADNDVDYIPVLDSQYLVVDE